MKANRSSSVAFRAVLLFPLVLAVPTGACERSRDPLEPALAAAAASPLENEYVAPGADGYGRAAGLRFLELCIGAEPNAALPMVVVVHGLGDHPGRHWLEAIQVPGPVRLILPQAPKPYMDGFSWFEFRADQERPEELARGIAAAENQLANLIEIVQVKRPTVGRPLLTGFSQGGMLSFALALNHPSLIALSVPISGMLPEPLWPRTGPAKGTPKIRALHGTADNVVEHARAQQLVTHLRALGYDATLKSFNGVAHGISDEMRALVGKTLARAKPALVEPAPRENVSP